MIFNFSLVEIISSVGACLFSISGSILPDKPPGYKEIPLLIKLLGVEWTGILLETVGAGCSDLPRSAKTE